MKNSQFENLLRKKALEFKPPVSASVLSGIKAASSISYPANGVILNIIHSLALKLVMGVAFLSSIAYFTINNTQKEDDHKSYVSSEIVQNNSIPNSLLLSENNKTVSKILLSPNSINKSISKVISRQNSHKKELFSDSERNNTDQSIIPNYNLISTSTNICNHTSLAIKSIPKLFSLDKLNRQDLILEDSIKLSSFNKAYLNTQDILAKTDRSPIKFSIRSGIQIGKSFFLNDKTNSSDHEEKHYGSMFSGDLAFLYNLNKHWRLGLKGSYQSLNIKSKFYSNNEQDGLINRKLTLLVFKAGIQYILLNDKKWSSHIMVHAGLANKLKHKNHFSGKYFDHSFSLDLKNENKWTPAADLSFMINYNFTKKLSLNVGVFSDFIRFNKNSKILSAGGQVGITYSL